MELIENGNGALLRVSGKLAPSLCLQHVKIQRDVGSLQATKGSSQESDHAGT